MKKYRLFAIRTLPRPTLSGIHGYSAFSKFISITFFLAISLGSFGSETTPENRPLHEADTAEKILQQSEHIGAIEITDRIADEEIESRIRKIFAASEWFDPLEVSVTEGIVVIEGETARREHRLWAETIATRTEGVVAVINRLALVQEAHGNLAPVITEGRDIVNKIVGALPIILSSLIILLLTFLLVKYAISLSFRLLASRIESAMLRRLVARISAVPLLIMGVYILLRITGLGALAATVIGGTGLLGLIIGFAFRDIVENFLASILISIERPFRLGDLIKVLEFTGVVQAVTTRGTVIMTLEGNHVQIPNTKIYKEAIVNLSANPNMRQDFVVGVSYDSSIAQAQSTALRILREHPAVLNEPESWVLVEELAAATINLRIYFWVDTKIHHPLKVKSAVIRIVKSTFIETGISMPDAAREIIFPQGIRVSTDEQGTTGEHKENNLQQKQPELPQEKGALPPTSGDIQVCTDAEGELDSDVPAINAQAHNSVLGDATENLLTK